MILVVGDAMMDRYWYGDVSRISPEAPVPVVAIQKTEERYGAAANVARTISALGSEARSVFSPTFKSDPVVKLRIVGRNQHVVRLDFDRPQEPIDMGEFKEALDGCSVVVISDYGKGALKNIEAVVTTAAEAGANVLVDPKGYRYEKYRGASMVKPNMDEMKVMIGGWESEDELQHKVNAMRVRAGIGAVLLTRGAAGMTLFDGGMTDIWNGHDVKQVVDVSGAGEAAIAAFAVAVEAGKQFKDAAWYANKAAGIAVTRFGTSLVMKEEVFG